MTHDMWHVTCYTWHVTRDTWHVTICGGWTLYKNFISLALIVFDLWYYEDLEEKAHGLNELISDKGVCRRAPATPGLLNTGEGSRSFGKNRKQIFLRMASLSYGVVKLWSCETMGLWSYGVVKLWICGVVNLWIKAVHGGYLNTYFSQI